MAQVQALRAPAAAAAAVQQALPAEDGPSVAWGGVSAAWGPPFPAAPQRIAAGLRRLTCHQLCSVHT